MVWKLVQGLAGDARPLILVLLVYSGGAVSLPTQTFQVTASIVNGCVVSGTNTGVFGTLDFGTQPGVG
ncbi:hypothetical protein V8N49_24715, partial [Erwinia aphidicola]